MIRMAKEIQFQSAGLLLEVFQKEYRGQERVFHMLNNRAGLTMVLEGIYLFLLMRLIPPIGDERVLFISGIGEVNLSGAIYLISVVLALIAFFYLLRVLVINRYRRIELDAQFVAKNGKRKKDRVAMDLIQLYQEVNAVNGMVLEKKQKAYQIAARLLSISVLFVVAYLLMVFISIR